MESIFGAVPIALVISTTFEREPAKVLRGSFSLDDSFIVGVGEMPVSFISQTIVLSLKHHEFWFLMIQSVLHKTVAEGANNDEAHSTHLPVYIQV